MIACPENEVSKKTNSNEEVGAFWLKNWRQFTLVLPGVILLPISNFESLRVARGLHEADSVAWNSIIFYSMAVFGNIFGGLASRWIEKKFVYKSVQHVYAVTTMKSQLTVGIHAQPAHVIILIRQKIATARSCRNKCDCKKGYRRNDCGVCIPEEKCVDSSKCTKFQPIYCPGQYERLIGCFDSTKARKCENRRNKPSSKPRSDGYCTLNPMNVIKSEETRCSDPNEIRYKKRCALRTCKNFLANRLDEKCECEKNVCDCKEGYYRDDCDRCVPEAQCCSKTQCKCTDPCTAKDNSYQCFNGCNKRTCSHFFSLPYTRCASNCTYGCQCTPPLWYNEKTGVCVDSELCPKPIR